MKAFSHYDCLAALPFVIVRREMTVRQDPVLLAVRDKDPWVCAGERFCISVGWLFWTVSIDLPF